MACTGCIYEKGGAQFHWQSLVQFCGTFTSSGEHRTSDAIQIGEHDKFNNNRHVKFSREGTMDPRSHMSTIISYFGWYRVFQTLQYQPWLVAVGLCKRSYALWMWRDLSSAGLHTHAVRLGRRPTCG